MLTISECRSIIEEELNKFKKKLPLQPERLYKPIEYILELGGKRIRPLLVLMANNLFSDDLEKAINPALAVEVFHNFTLLHDDMMDNDSIRRGKKTVHKVWNENIAILSGDAMSILSYKLLVETPNKNLPQMISIYNDMAVEVCEGQQHDMDFENRDDVSEEEYLEMIRLKTAALIAGSLKLGAVAAGAPEKDADLIYDFGLNLGLAFQIQDDFLDVFGDESKFGKPIGSDIIARKKTLLMISAYEKADAETKKELNNTLGSDVITDPDKINTVRDIYISLNINHYARKMMESYYSRAMNSLKAIKVDDKLKTELKAIARTLIHRES